MGNCKKKDGLVVFQVERMQLIRQEREVGKSAKSVAVNCWMFFDFLDSLADSLKRLDPLVEFDSLVAL